MKTLFILSVLALSSGCVEETKEIISDVKHAIVKSPIGKHCDVKNKIVCYEQNNQTGFYCVQVEKPICSKKEEIK